jgi:hypothetical protein
MSELDAALATTANEPSAPTPDAVLDAAFDSPSTPADSPQPSGESDPAAEPVAATQQPQSTEQPNVGAKGEPPRERWDSILENTRSKSEAAGREKALAEHREALEIVERLRTDFTGTLAQLLEEGSTDPRFSEQLTSRAAAILAARNQAAKADAEPEADLQTADGALVYSAEQLRKWHQWNQTQTEKKLSQQFAPLQQLQQRLEQHQQTQQVVQQAAQVAEVKGARWKAMPHFAEHQAAIVARQAEIYAEMQGQPGFDPMGSPWDALQQAYTEVVTTQAIPKLRSAQTGQFIADAARKRAGSSSDPSASAPAQARKPRTMDEALEQVFGGIA